MNDDFLTEIGKITGNKSLIQPKPQEVDVTPLLEQMRESVKTQESSGDLDAVNPRTGARSLFQVLPENIPAWTQKHLKRRMSVDEFVKNPDAQNQVFTGEMGEYLRAAKQRGVDDDTAIRMAAAGWYGGKGRMDRYDDPIRFRPDEPSFREYTTSVLDRIKKSKKNIPSDDFLTSLNKITATVLPAPQSFKQPEFLDDLGKISGNNFLQDTAPVVQNLQTQKGDLERQLLGAKTKKQRRQIKQSLDLLTKSIEQTTQETQIAPKNTQSPTSQTKTESFNPQIETLGGIPNNAFPDAVQSPPVTLADFDPNQAFMFGDPNKQGGANLSQLPQKVDPEYLKYLKYTQQKDSPEIQAQYQNLLRSDFGKNVEVAASVDAPQESSTQNSFPTDAAVLLQNESNTNRVVRNDADLLGAQAARVAVDLAKAPAGMDKNEFAIRASMRAIAQDYGLTDADIERAVGILKGTDGTLLKQGDVNDRNDVINVRVPFGNIVAALGGTAQNIPDVVRKKFGELQGDRQLRLATSEQPLEKDEFGNPVLARDVLNTENREMRKTEDELLREQAIKNMMASPLVLHNEEGIQNEIERLKKMRFDRADKEDIESFAVGSGNTTGGSFVSGLVGATGRTVSLLSGAMRPLDELGLLPEDWFAKTAKFGLKLSASDEEYAKKVADHSQIMRILGGASLDIPRYIALAMLPGGVVTAFAVDEGLQSAGRNERIEDIIKNTSKGVLLGAIFKGSSKLGRAAESGALRAFVNPVFDAGKTATASQSLVAKVFGEGVRVGSLGSGTFTVERLYGATNEEALNSAIGNALFDLASTHGKGALQGIKGLTDKVIRFWKSGNPVDVTVKSNGDIVRLGRQAEKEFVDVEMVLDPVDNVYKQKGNIDGNPAPERNANFAGNAVNEQTANAARNFQNLETSAPPRELAEQNPSRIDAPMPDAVQRASIDTRAQRIVENLQGKDAVSIDDLAKLTKFNKKNVEDAVMLLYGARQVEILPDNRIRFIGGENSQIQPKTIFERAQEANKSGDLGLSKPTNSGGGANSNVVLPSANAPLETRAESFNAQIQRAENPVRNNSGIEFADPPDIAQKLNVFTERGTRAQVSPMVVDSSELLTSLDPDYPMSLQPRDRSRLASKAQISEIANKLNPEFLGDSPKASDGRPLVVPVKVNGAVKYAVVSGNGRSEGIKSAYDLAKADSYRAFVQTKTDDENKRNLQRPVYVGVLDPKEIPDLPEFAKEANESATAQMSATEQARSDAERLDGDILNLFVPSEDGTIHGAANRDFTRAFLSRAVPVSEQNRLVDGNGVLNQDGVSRVKNAIFAAAFGSSEKGLSALQRMTESTDNNVRNITNGLLASSGGIVTLKQAIAGGKRYPEFDISNDLAIAMEKYAALRENSISMDEYIAQGNLFGSETSPFQTRVMQVFDNYKRSPKAVRTIISNFLNIAEAAGNPNQQNLFGEKAEIDVKSAFEAAVENYEREYRSDETEQSGLFDNEDQGLSIRSETEGNDAENAAAEENRKIGQVKNKIVGFKTAKGSSYIVDGQSTQRDKSFHPEHGAEDIGLKEKSVVTYYGGRDSGLLSDAGSIKPAGARSVIRIEENNNGTLTGERIYFNPVRGEWVKTSSVVLSKLPEIGKYPIELWKPEIENGQTAYSKIHAGNEIIELSEREDSNNNGQTANEPTTGNAVAENGSAPLEFQETKPAEQKTYKFSSTQVNLPEDIANRVREFARVLIPEKDLAEDGYEDTPHITVKYGLHTQESDDVEDVLDGTEAVKATLGKTRIFEGKDSDVVIIAVKSPDLRKLNKEIAANTKVTDTFPTYKPHVTLAYVKKGEGKKYAGLTNFDGVEIDFDTVQFSSKTGDKTDIPLAEDTASANTKNSEPQAKVVTVGERQVTLTSQQAARWENEVEKPLESAKRKRDSAIKQNPRYRESFEKEYKAAAIRLAAKKREITGLFTEKEKAEIEKREKSNYLGKNVSVNGRNAKVVGNSFGKVKVKFDDDASEKIVEPDFIKPPDNTANAPNNSDSETNAQQFSLRVKSQSDASKTEAPVKRTGFAAIMATRQTAKTFTKTAPDNSVSDFEIFNSTGFENELDSIKTLRNSDGELLAPNGKVSNIQDLRVWKTVRTNAFKKWFGDWGNDAANASKVVDENGEPLVVYHGTRETFETFKTSGLGGMFFTPNKLTASMIAGFTKNPLEVFLNLRDPKFIATNKDNGLWEAGFDKEQIEKAKKNSSDGIIFSDTDGNAGYFVAFEPNQIKSVTNEGSFSKENDSILKYKKSESYRREETLLAKKLSDLSDNSVSELGEKAKAKRNEETQILELNPEAATIISFALRQTGEAGDPFFGVYLAPDTADLVRANLYNFGKAVYRKGNLKASAQLKKLMQEFDKAQNNEFKDVSIAVKSELAPKVFEQAREEEAAHRADFRVRNFERKDLEPFKKLDSYRKAVENVRKDYEDASERQLHNEVIAKTFRSDAVNVLGIDANEIKQIRKAYRKQLIKNSIPPEKFKKEFSNISKNADEAIKDYERLFRKTKGNLGEDVANRRKQSLSSNEGVREVRGTGRGYSSRFVDEKSRNVGIGFDEPNPNPTQSLVRASPKDVAEVSKSFNDFEVQYSKPTKPEIDFWKRFIKNERQTSYKDIITNFRRAGLLTGVRTHLKNMASNTLMQAGEEATRPIALLADLAASAVTGKRTVGSVSPKGLLKSFAALVRADETMRTLNQESGIARAWNILVNGDIKELKKNQLSEMRSGLPVFDMLVNGVFRLLGAEDALFKTYAIRRSLEEQAHTRAVTDSREKLSKFNNPLDRQKFIRERRKELLADPSKEMLLEAMLYADFVTFTNDNPISDIFKKIKDVDEKLKFVLETIVPYDKTPTNVILRSLEYTPAGFLVAGKHLSNLKKGESYTFDKLRDEFMREYEDLDGNRVAARIKLDKKIKDAIEKLNDEIGKAASVTDKLKLQKELANLKDIRDKIKGKRKVKDAFREADRRNLEQSLENLFPRIEQQMFARAFGRAGLGTAALALGIYLAMRGLLAGSLDPGNREDSKEFYKRREKGILNGSLVIGNRRYQINDTPLGKSMVIGASIWEKSQKKSKKGENAITRNIADVADVGGDLITQQPLLNSLNDYFGSNKTVEKRIGGLLGSFVPTILADVADVTDNEARQNEEIMDAGQNRIPFLRENNEKADKPREPFLRDRNNRIVNKFDPFNTRPVNTNK